MDDRVVITLLRHGLTKKNKEKKYIGWTDESICEDAKHVLKETANHYPDAEIVHTSDLKRCVETASILYPFQIINKHAGFREVHFGDWEDQTYHQLKKCKDYRNWLTDITNFCPPNGEHYQTFKARVLNSWNEIIEEILQNEFSRIVLVTHGGPIRILLECFAPEVKSFWEWNIAHGKGVQLVYSKKKLEERARCISLREVPLMEKRNG